MRSHSRHHYLPRDTVSLAGWLFADLLLGLSMLFFVFNTVGPKPVEPVQPTSTPRPTLTSTRTATPVNTSTPTPTYTATPTYTPIPQPTEPVSLSTDPVTLLIKTNPSRLLGSGTARADEQTRIKGILRQRFAQYEIAHQRAGIVLSFGTAPTALTGGRLSTAVNQLLVEELPQVFVSGSTVMRNFHFISANQSQYGDVEIEVYFILGSP
jgi:hypothetical protein